jgi:hypothetical protein
LYLQLKFTVQWVFRVLTRGAQVGLLPTAALFEEGAKESGGFVAQDSALVGVGVVQTRIGGEVVEGTGGAGFGILGGINEATYASGVKGASAHGAGFEGGVECAAGEAPAAELAGGATEGEELGVGRRVFQCLAFVVGRRQDLSILGDHGADGYLSPLGSQRGLFEGAAHQAQVSLCFGPRLRCPGLFGFVVWFKFLWHGADNSNAARYDQRGGRADRFFVIGGIVQHSRAESMAEGREVYERL